MVPHLKLFSICGETGHPRSSANICHAPGLAEARPQDAMHLPSCSRGMQLLRNVCICFRGGGLARETTVRRRTDAQRLQTADNVTDHLLYLVFCNFVASCSFPLCHGQVCVTSGSFTPIIIADFTSEPGLSDGEFETFPEVESVAK